MQVTIEIDGRKALPIRAIPYVCAWSYGAAPDDIVQTLAAPKIKKFYGLAIRLRHNELFAYQMDAHGRYEQLPPSQWENLVFNLEILAKTLQENDKREGVDNKNYEIWQKKAVLKLLDNVFIWLDEFQHWYSSTRPIDLDSADVEHVASEDEDGVRLEKEDDTLCLTPIIPPKIENRLWRYAKDFEKQTAQKEKGVTATTPTPPEDVSSNEEFIGWYDYPLNASVWWQLKSITPLEAAKLLCQFNTDDDKDDPTTITNDETAPEDYKLLLRVFEDEEKADAKARNLNQWRDIARDKKLKYHTWIDKYEQAMKSLESAAPAAKGRETTPGDDWKEKARAIADECFDHDTNANPPVRDSLATKNSVGQIIGGYCFRVMVIMQECGIKGARGFITNPATIMREALQGKKWWRNKNK